MMGNSDMVTKHSPELGGDAPRKPPEEGDVRTVGWVQHHVCAVCGLVAALLVMTFLTPVLFVAVEPFRFLSSTALVFAVLVAWLVVSITLELVWDWSAGWLSTANRA